MALRQLILLVFSLYLAKPIAAAEVETTIWRDHRVLSLTGEIDSGTADRVLELSSAIAPLPHGHPVVLLNSNGGSVSEALAIASILSSRDYHTVVPNGSSCASACASIVFVSGALRTIETKGALGQHSCSRNGIPDQACNDLLAQHAMKHGVSHGSVAAFVTYSRPDEMVWFSREDADG